METVAAAGLVECLVTLVTPGSSDRVIRVFPAEHKSEKIWLDNTPGIERWEAVERLLNNHAERGTRVPKPASYHSSSKDLRNVDLKPEDIPLVRLDGAVFEAPPAEERIDYAKLMPASVNAAKLEELGKTVSSLAQAVSHLTQLVSAQHAAPAKASVVAPVTSPSPDEAAAFSCGWCPKSFSGKHALSIHMGREHKGR